MDPNIETFIGCDSSFEKARIVLFGAPFLTPLHASVPAPGSALRHAPMRASAWRRTALTRTRT